MQTGTNPKKSKENHVIKKLTTGALLETAWAIGISAGPILPFPSANERPASGGTRTSGGLGAAGPKRHPPDRSGRPGHRW